MGDERRSGRDATVEGLGGVKKGEVWERCNNRFMFFFKQEREKRKALEDGP